MIRKITLLIGMGLLIAAVGYSQAPTPGPAPAPGQSPRAAAPAAADKTYEGRLTKVDAAAKTITVAALNPQQGDAKDMTFTYSEQTVVVGGDRTVQGLDGKTGSTLKITFAPGHEGNMASRIEISDKP